MPSHEGRDQHRPVSRRVVEAVAAENGADPADLDPLYYSVDPESLDALFGDETRHAGRNGCRVRFRYAGNRVTVSRDGSVSVSATGEAENPEWHSGSSHPSGQPEAPD